MILISLIPVQATTYFDGLWDGIYFGLIEDQCRYVEAQSNLTDEDEIRGLNEGWDTVKDIKTAKGIEKQIKKGNLVYTLDNIYFLVSPGNRDIYDHVVDLAMEV